jgi:hypothetical protein
MTTVASGKVFSATEFSPCLSDVTTSLRRFSSLFSLIHSGKPSAFSTQP